jgi:glyoxylase-like metal-dependent hydrolase (beta-lactamase superfamily II)
MALAAPRAALIPSCAGGTLRPVTPAQPAVERVAEGVRVLRLRPPGRAQRLTNVYLLDDGDGVTLFESGSVTQAAEIAAAAPRIGRVVLSHAHADHRGGASKLGAPVLCHADERADVEGDGGEHYYDWSKVGNPLIRALGPRTLARMDGGPVAVSETLSEGDEIAGFAVLHLPGHAPGLIGLWREADRLAIVSDAVFVCDPFTVTARPGHARMPPAPVRPDDAAARASIRRIAALDPAVVWLGHYGPLVGDVGAQLERAALSP